MTMDPLSDDLERAARALRRSDLSPRLERRLELALQRAERAPRPGDERAPRRTWPWAAAGALALAGAGTAAALLAWPREDWHAVHHDVEVALEAGEHHEWVVLPTRLHEHHGPNHLAIEFETPVGVDFEPPHAVTPAAYTSCDDERCLHRWEAPTHEDAPPLRVRIGGRGDHAFVLRSHSGDRVLHETFVARAR